MYYFMQILRKDLFSYKAVTLTGDSSQCSLLLCMEIPLVSLLFFRAYSLNSFISPTHALYIKTLHKHPYNFLNL